MAIRKATKQKQKARLLFYGLSGSGKSNTSLEIASLLTSGKIVVIDTENETTSLYSDQFDFDILPVDSPYSLDKLAKDFKEAESHVGEGGVIIIDTLTKYWDGVGGALDEVNTITNGQKSKTQEAWGKVTPKVAKARESLVSSKTAHVIVTCRVKSETIMEEYVDWQGKTKTKSVKVGLAPVFKDGIEYDYDVALEFSFLTTKTGKDIQVIRNTKPPRVPYFRDFQCCISENDEGIQVWNAKSAVDNLKFFLDQGVNPKTINLIDRIRQLLSTYKENTNKEHDFSKLELDKLSVEELTNLGKELREDVDKSSLPQ